MKARLIRRLLVLLTIITATALANNSASFELKYDQLQPSLDELTAADRDVVADAIGLIKKGDHVLALSRLTSLKQRSPHNSSLRLLAAYALLQVGNVLGAFEESEEAHNSPGGGAYKCWFHAKVALLNGKKEICEREIKHLKGAGEMVAEVRQLEDELAATGK